MKDSMRNNLLDCVERVRRAHLLGNGGEVRGWRATEIADDDVEEALLIGLRPDVAAGSHGVVSFDREGGQKLEISKEFDCE